MQAAGDGQVERAHPGVDPLRVRHAIGNGRAHVGVAKLGEHRAVGVRHHRMDDALRVDQHLDLLRRGAEQPMGLDHLEPLVHHRGRIHRDLAAHHPFGVGAGLVRRDVVQGGRITRPERAARCGQQHLGHARAVARVAGRQALEDRVVLTVDGQQRGAVLAHRVHEDGARHDQRFLVGQQHALARPSGGERRTEPGRADDGGHHGIGAVVGGDGFQRGFAIADFGLHAAAAQQRLELACRVRGAHHGVRRAELHAGRRQLIHLAVGAQRMHAVAVRMPTHYVECAFADGARGAQDGNALHRNQITKFRL
ncbi:hypothetical protein D3C81_969500 [compost metagenome]